MNRQLELERHVALNEIERRQRTIDALVTALEEFQRVARAEIGKARADLFEQADAALALAALDRNYKD